MSSKDPKMKIQNGFVAGSVDGSFGSLDRYSTITDNVQKDRNKNRELDEIGTARGSQSILFLCSDGFKRIRKNRMVSND